MDIRQLELFLAVMDNTGVTLAAQKMYITPDAISLQPGHHFSSRNA
ncbi:MAG: LysR family transcriptional regulator [Bryobacteraceae bacterium]|jgi:DNA-binding transcriptional LysR family regulator